MVKKQTRTKKQKSQNRENDKTDSEKNSSQNLLDKSLFPKKSRRKCHKILKAQFESKKKPKKLYLCKKERQAALKSKSLMLCYRHSDRKIQFICLNRSCLQELCSFCILEHKDHVDEIKPLEDVIKENAHRLAEFQEKDIQESVQKNQEKSFNKIQEFCEKMKQLVFEKINQFKENLINHDGKIEHAIEQILSFCSFFKNYSEDSSGFINEKSLNLIRASILQSDYFKTHFYTVEKEIITRLFEKLLDNNIQISVNGNSMNSTTVDVPKYLHWFEWEKRELHLFDIIENTFQVIKLITTFKTAAFSRSVILPEGKILLIGGQDTNFGAKKDVYCFDITKTKPELNCTILQSMPFKKYDFSVCFHDGFVYVFCGKDSDTMVDDSCERYDVKNNIWHLLAPVNKKRYAASASVIKETNKIYLFGGRADYNTSMVSEIEEYSITKNVWRILRLSNFDEWIPVEVCASVQIAPGKILIFGGSDIHIDDSKNSYIFTPHDLKITKTVNLKKPQVFVNLPFVNGNFVFAPGNEYYVKSRNIHKFNIKTFTWDIIK